MTWPIFLLPLIREANLRRVDHLFKETVRRFMKKIVGMFIVSSVSLLGLTSVALAPHASAQDEMRKMENGPGTYKISSTDQLVLSKIHHANTMEVKAAKLALQRSDSPEIKQVAQQIIKDHTAADVDVKAVAKADNIRLLVPLIPQNDADKIVMSQHKADMASLEKLHGIAFDTQYQKMMVDAHKADIAELTNVQPKLQNENARDLVEKLIPKFQHHEQILAQIDVNKNTNTASNQ
jgi:putative membrane protein